MDVEIVELAPQHTAVVRDTVPMEGLPEFFGRAYGAVFAELGQLGIAPASAPFGYYPSMPGEVIEVEAGVVVGSPVTANGEVVPSHLPDGLVATTIHKGPYDSLADTYAAMSEWAEGEGWEARAGCWECYLTDPGDVPDPADWLTELFMPLKRREG